MYALSRATRTSAALGLAAAIWAAGSCGEEREQGPDTFGAEAERIAGGLIEMGTDRPPQATRCSVRPDATSGTGPVVHGWRRDHSRHCCGMAKCIDPLVCGDSYGQKIWRCGDCTYYDCTYRPDELQEIGVPCHVGGRPDQPRQVEQ
jgi:hypothetical protein